MRRAGVIIIASILLTLACAPGPASAGGRLAQPRLVIPRMHLDVAVGSTLAVGPAFYNGSGRPGQPYTIAIAGHRTTHTHPFWSLDVLRKGDRIVLVTGGARHVYVVSGSRVVAPNDWSIAREQGHERLILSTCTPRFSAAHRLVVFALPATAR